MRMSFEYTCNFNSVAGASKCELEYVVNIEYMVYILCIIYVKRTKKNVLTVLYQRGRRKQKETL